MMVKTAKLCTKTVTGRSLKYRNPCVLASFSKKRFCKRKFFIVQGEFCKIIDIERTEFCYLSV